jgi:AraC-like DNA-binding protein
MRHSTFRYLPPRQRDTDWGLHVSGAGAARIRPGEPYPPTGHPELYDFSWSRGRTLPEFSIVLISQGRGVFESLETGEQAVDAGTAMLLFPGIWHRYRPVASTGWAEWWVAFSGDHIDRLIAKRFFSAQVPLLRPPAIEPLLAIFEKIIGQQQDVAAGRSHMLAAHVLEILAILAKDAQPALESQWQPERLAVPTAADGYVNEALRIIWTESHAELTVRRLARRLGLSTRSLERRFHRCLQRTIRDAIQECRVARAERLLAETNLPITSIVSAAGFCSYDGMRRALTKSLGHAPSKLRLLLQERVQARNARTIAGDAGAPWGTQPAPGSAKPAPQAVTVNGSVTPGRAPPRRQ